MMLIHPATQIVQRHVCRRLGAMLSIAAMAWLQDGVDPSRADYGSYSMVHQILMGVLLALLLNTSTAAAATFIDGSEGDFRRSARGQEGKVRT